ncbi:MAG TPA: IPT/TIG domain-containing protein, partial [Polyangiaceae bacterium]
MSLLGLATCLKQGPPISLHKVTDDDGGTSTTITSNPGVADAGATVDVGLGPIDPHALIGVNPSHGPWNGGQARIVLGNGFKTGLRVWFGGNEVTTQNVVPIDPSRAQVIVPPGTPGAADVKTQIADDPSTARTLAGAYLYEDFYADPSTGPTSGGTNVHLLGEDTHWADGTTVTVDALPCTQIQILTPTELTCLAPPDTPGAKAVNVTSPDKVSAVRDAFTYADSNNGFVGGLSGATLGSNLQVLVYDAFSGSPISGAFVLAGDDVATGVSARTDSTGGVHFGGVNLAPSRSVTVAAKCYQPTTFVDVTVDTVTAYLSPVISPPCIPAGDPPTVGGRGIFLSTINGELVWPLGGEFRSTAWSNVPRPAANEKLSAYVFRLTSNPSATFFLPDPSNAATPDRTGDLGPTFQYGTTLGNLTLYALAGLEDRSASPPRFTAYAMGIVRGVSAAPGVTTNDVFIPIDIPLDHAVTLSASAPIPGPRGPDRASFSMAVEVEKSGYAILPVSSQQWLLPIQQQISFVGLPPLSNELQGARYVASALAGTGPSLSAPLSQVGRFASTTESVALDGFVPVPVLAQPTY